ncbi:MAG TPA: LptE family protein [Methylomirabilota bacterium]|jgi:outer membrane lipopolysaccharide assembly protein LptE/RlpB
MTTPARFLAPAVIVLVLLGGCGYSFRGNLPDHIQTVAVPIFVNKTSEPGVENFLTSAVVEAFSTNGRLRVVRPDRADAILDGEVVGYEVQSIAFDPNANVRQYRLLVTLNLKMRDVRQDKILVDHRGLQERADFRVLGAVAQTISREESALRQAAVEIGRSVVSLTLDRF